MSVITVQQDHQGGGVEFTTLHLFRRESLRFGRGGGPAGAAPHLDLVIAEEDEAVARCAGIIESLGHHWRLTNTSGIHTYIVEHTDPVAGYVQVRPEGRGPIIPFETSRVRIPGGSREYSFLVLAPSLPARGQGEGGEAGGEVEGEAGGEERVVPMPFRLDPWHSYFRVLVAFCEPRLRDRRHQDIPGVDEVAQRLGLSQASVEAHIDYLLKGKLRVPHGDAAVTSTCPRRMLVDYALRFDLVAPEHLALLPDPEGGAAG